MEVLSDILVIMSLILTAAAAALVILMIIEKNQVQPGEELHPWVYFSDEEDESKAGLPDLSFSGGKYLAAWLSDGSLSVFVEDAYIEQLDSLSLPIELISIAGKVYKVSINSPANPKRIRNLINALGCCLDDRAPSKVKRLARLYLQGYPFGSISSDKHESKLFERD